MGIRHQKRRQTKEQQNNAQQPAKKKGRLMHAFAKACRRGILGAFMGVSLLMPFRANAPGAPASKASAKEPVATTVIAEKPVPAVTAAPQKAKALYKPHKQQTEKKPEVKALTPYDLLSDQAKADINEQLIAKAREQFHNIMKRNDVDYSKHLDSLQNALTTEIRVIQNDTTKTVAVIDAYDLDVGIALGLTHMGALIHIFQEKNIPINERQIWTLYWNTMIAYITSVEDNTYSQGPFCLPPLPGQNDLPTILLPASDNTLMITIDDLAFDKVVELVNRHESWHVLDNRYDMTVIDYSKLQDVDMKDPASIIANEEALKYMALMSKVETSADVAAVCEMIRSGSATLGLIDLLSTSRAQASHDILHMSPPVLAGLKVEIEKIGIEALIAMTHEEARDFYYRVTSQYGMSETAIEYCMKMKIADEEQKVIYCSMAERDPEIAKGIVLFDLVSAPGKPDATIINHQLKEQMADYDPLKELKDRAFRIDQMVTPESMIKAYASLMNELAETRKANPSEDEILTNKMTRVKMAFVKNLTSLDYVEINRELGVPLEKLSDQKTYVMAYQVPAHVKHIGPRYG